MTQPWGDPPEDAPVEQVDPDLAAVGTERVHLSLFAIACWGIGLFNAVLWVVTLIILPWVSPLPFLTAVVFCGLGLGAGKHAREL